MFKRIIEYIKKYKKEPKGVYSYRCNVDGCERFEDVGDIEGKEVRRILITPHPNPLPTGRGGILCIPLPLFRGRVREGVCKTIFPFLNKLKNSDTPQNLLNDFVSYINLLKYTKKHNIRIVPVKKDKSFIKVFLFKSLTILMAFIFMVSMIQGFLSTQRLLNAFSQQLHIIRYLKHHYLPLFQAYQALMKKPSLFGFGLSQSFSESFQTLLFDLGFETLYIKSFNRLTDDIQQKLTTTQEDLTLAYACYLQFIGQGGSPPYTCQHWADHEYGSVLAFMMRSHLFTNNLSPSLSVAYLDTLKERVYASNLRQIYLTHVQDNPHLLDQPFKKVTQFFHPRRPDVPKLFKWFSRDVLIHKIQHGQPLYEAVLKSLNSFTQPFPEEIQALKSIWEDPQTNAELNHVISLIPKAPVSLSEWKAALLGKASWKKQVDESVKAFMDRLPAPFQEAFQKRISSMLRAKVPVHNFQEALQKQWDDYLAEESISEDILKRNRESFWAFIDESIAPFLKSTPDISMHFSASFLIAYSQWNVLRRYLALPQSSRFSIQPSLSAQFREVRLSDGESRWVYANGPLRWYSFPIRHTSDGDYLLLQVQDVEGKIYEKIFAGPFRVLRWMKAGECVYRKRFDKWGCHWKFPSGTLTLSLKLPISASSLETLFANDISMPRELFTSELHRDAKPLLQWSKSLGYK